MLTADEVLKLIPQQRPFRFIDRLVELNEARAVGEYTYRADESFFAGHFPNRPVMPGVLIIEALAQVGGVVMLCVHENHGKIAYLMSIDSAKFRQPVFPGDTLRLEVEVVKSRSKTGQCIGKAYVGSRLICEAEVKFAVVDGNNSEGK
jgi:beta-hydroxyacyl-ACP dehydratase FabZ